MISILAFGFSIVLFMFHFDFKATQDLDFTVHFVLSSFFVCFILIFFQLSEIILIDLNETSNVNFNGEKKGGEKSIHNVLIMKENIL